jgi:hypothetical protein
VIKLLQSEKELPFESLIKKYFASDDKSHWIAVVFFLYGESIDYSSFNLKEILEKLACWFNIFFFNWKEETHYFVDAMALRIMWDAFGYNIFRVLEEKKRQLIKACEDEKIHIEKYCEKIKYATLRSFKMEESNEKTIDEMTIEWTEKIGENSFLSM